MSILRKYITVRVLDESYKLTPSGTYYAPPEGELDTYREYIKSLPPAEAPEVFGMHPNANISFQLQETRRLIDTVLSIQVRKRGVAHCWSGYGGCPFPWPVEHHTFWQFRTLQGLHACRYIIH